MLAKFNIKNKVFGRLTVLKLISKAGAKNSKWLCICDCGKKVSVRSDCLRYGSTKSCGCYKLDMIRKAVSLKFGTASFNHLYSVYKREASKRNYKFNLSKKQFKKLTKQNCYYCGVKPSQIVHPKSCNGEYIYNGIDRVDSKQGYTTKNCVSCCKTCNKMKMELPLSNFLNKIKLVYERHLK